MNAIKIVLSTPNCMCVMIVFTCIVNWSNDLPGILGNIKVKYNPAGRVKIGVVMVYTHKELQFYSSFKSKVYKRCFTRKCESKTEMC